MRRDEDRPDDGSVQLALSRYTTKAVWTVLAAAAAFGVFLAAPSATGVFVGSLIAGSAGSVCLYRALKLRGAISHATWRMYRIRFGEVGSVNFPSTGLYTVFALLPEGAEVAEPVLGTFASTWAWRPPLLRRASRGGVWATRTATGTLALIAPGSRTLYYARGPKTAREARRWRRALAA